MNTQKMVVTTMKNDQEQTIMIKACSQPKAEVLEIYTALKYKPMPYQRKKFVFPQSIIWHHQTHAKLQFVGYNLQVGLRTHQQWYILGIRGRNLNSLGNFYMIC